MSAWIESEEPSPSHPRTATHRSSDQAGTAPSDEDRSAPPHPDAEDDGTKFDPYERAILAYLRAHPGWHSPAFIRRSTGGSAPLYSRTVKRLLVRGLVERRGDHPRTEYRSGAMGETGGASQQWPRDLDSVAQSLLEALTVADHPLLSSELLDILGCGESQYYPVLRALLDTGQIVLASKSPKPAYALASGGPRIGGLHELKCAQREHAELVLEA